VVDEKVQKREQGVSPRSGKLGDDAQIYVMSGGLVRDSQNSIATNSSSLQNQTGTYEDIGLNMLPVSAASNEAAR
jgi:hypothetical protein